MSQRAGSIEPGPRAEGGMDFQSAMETFAEAWVAANTKTDQVQRVISQFVSLGRAMNQSGEVSLAWTPLRGSAGSTGSYDADEREASMLYPVEPVVRANETHVQNPRHFMSQALALTHKASPPSRPNSVSSLPRSPPSHQSQQQQHHQQQQQQQQSTTQPTSIHSSHQSQTSVPMTPQVPPFIAHNQHPKQEINSSPKQEGFDLSKSSTVTGKSPVPVHCVVEAIHSIVESRLSIAREKWRSPHVEIDTYVIIPAAVPFQDLVGEALVRLGYPTDLIPSARGSIVIRNWKPLPMEKVADEPLRTVGDILAELTTVATLKIQVYRSRPPPPSPAAEVRDKLLRLLLLHSHALLVSAGCPLDEMTLSSLCRGGNDLSEETRRNFETWLQQQQLGLGLNSMIPSSNHHHTQSPRPDSGGPIGHGGPIGPPHPAMLPYSHKTRMRTSFDPELELPRLQRWFSENQHPSRQQIQHYVSELNSLESRRGRKPLDVNNVVYWFKNARAAQKRAETRGINGYSPPGLSPRGASIISEDCSDEEEDSRHQSTSPSPCPPSSPPVGPLSLTTRPEDQQPPTSSPSVKREETRVSSGSEDDEASPTGSLPPGFSLVPSPIFHGHGIMYMSPYLPPRGPPGCPSSMLDERRKRNRTFIDPVTEVPRLEAWFGHNTHPSHALILKYTEELNRMPYRQKFPRLEPKNVQFWFKNRRAKCKRLKMALFDGESPQPHPYHAD